MYISTLGYGCCPMTMMRTASAHPPCSRQPAAGGTSGTKAVHSELPGRYCLHAQLPGRYCLHAQLPACGSAAFWVQRASRARPN
jgi:hypothetical protein